MIELFKEIWSTAKRNKLRTSLTGFAVAWGIFMLIFLLGAGNGLINANLDQSGRFLANSMKIFGGQTSKAHKGLKEGRPISLNERDVNMTDKTFDENTEAVGSVLSQYGVNISLGENYISAQTLNGVYPSEADINKREVISGRFINDIDMKERRKVIALWQTQAKELAHDYLSLVGRDVKVGDLVFKVIGIVKDDKQQQNNDAFIPYTTLKAIYAKGDEAGNIQFEIKGLVTEEQNKEFERNYRAHLNIQHDAAPDDESAVYIWNRYMDNIQMAQGIVGHRTVHPSERYCGCVEHHAHHREGAHTRVWSAQGNRSKAMADTQTYHYRECHYHRYLWIHRNALWYCCKRIYGCDDRA